GATLGELQTLYDSLDRDLVEARKIQQSLVRDRERDFGSAKVSLMLRPSGHVGGDLVGYVPLSLRKLGLFAIDVSGHGVASAMLAARLAGMLSGIAGHADASIVGSTGPLDPWPPEIVARNLNRALIDVVRVEQYITCIYALADLATGRVELVQAGHPHPLVLRADGRVQMVGRGGLPVGLVDRASWDRTVVDLAPGDRLFLMSDGLTECPGPDGLELGEDGVAEIVRRQTELRGTRFLDALHWEVERFAAGRDAADDMSAVLYEFGI
ncbi:MAG: PP2C family protein-serine/threonine phosphatase, partial [Gemmobacter sp.]